MRSHIIALLVFGIIAVALSTPVPGYGGHHSHHVIHVPYHVHTVHHHHVKKVPVHHVEKVHVPVPIPIHHVQKVHVPVPVHHVEKVHVPVPVVEKLPLDYGLGCKQGPPVFQAARVINSGNGTTKYDNDNEIGDENLVEERTSISTK
ncbi:hypothetical protein KM043_018654 [Ampulex compressa]|nr:hypothetical protein KM043_018654 [Ampulex compressa]